MIKARLKYPTDLYGTIYNDNIQKAVVICLIIPTTFPFDAYPGWTMYVIHPGIFLCWIQHQKKILFEWCTLSPLYSFVLVNCYELPWVLTFRWSYCSFPTSLSKKIGKIISSQFLSSKGTNHQIFTRLTWHVSLVEQELLTLPEHLSSPPVFSGVHVTRSLVLYVCFVDRCLSFCLLSLPNKVWETYCFCSVSYYVTPNAVGWRIAILRFFFTIIIIIIIIIPHIFVRSISQRCLDQTLWNLVGIS